MIKIDKQIKLPKYVVKALCNSADYVNKASIERNKFINWVTKNVDEDFDFGLLDASYDIYKYDYGTEILAKIEYGMIPSDEQIEEIEYVLNRWLEDKNNSKEDD